MTYTGSDDPNDEYFGQFLTKVYTDSTIICREFVNQYLVTAEFRPRWDTTLVVDGRMLPRGALYDPIAVAWVADFSKSSAHEGEVTYRTVHGVLTKNNHYYTANTRRADPSGTLPDNVHTLIKESFRAALQCCNWPYVTLVKWE